MRLRGATIVLLVVACQLGERSPRREVGPGGGAPASGAAESGSPANGSPESGSPESGSPASSDLASGEPGHAARDAVLEPATARDSAIVADTWAYVDEIDQWLEEWPSDQLLFARLGDGRWVRVPGPERWPEGTVHAAAILADDEGHILQVLTSPVDTAGVRLERVTHIFDDSGRTVFFERVSTLGEGGCGDRPVHEVSQYFFDPSFALIHRTYELLDDEERPLDPDACDTGERGEHRIERSAAALLAEAGLADAVREALRDAERRPVVATA